MVAWRRAKVLAPSKHPLNALKFSCACLQLLQRITTNDILDRMEQRIDARRETLHQDQETICEAKRVAWICVFFYRGDKLLAASI
jgi:hypothetical protein